MGYLDNAFGTVATPQSEPIPGSAQVQNNAGGYTWRSTTGRASSAS